MLQNNSNPYFTTSLVSPMGKTSTQRPQNSPKSSFQKVLSSLNPAQYQAVETIEGPVMVVAGPGTGKTQVLSARIAQILSETDTLPSSILALTFTESAAANMRQRLVKMIGVSGYQVTITTFHSFCSQVIQSHPEYFPIDRGSAPLSDIEKFQLFEQLLKDLPLESLKPLNSPLFYLREVISAISNLKREGVSVEEFQEMVAAAAVAAESELSELSPESKSKTKKLSTAQQRELTIQARQRELGILYEAYEQKIRQTLRYDFDDMISLVVKALESEELLLAELQEKFLYVLVDEYQDTNTAQNQIVDQLTSHWGDQANVFVVGDPHQAIYRFQGASTENVVGFLDRYPTVQVINLEIGYRCGQEVYETAAKLMTNLSDAQSEQLQSLKLSKALTAAQGKGQPVVVHEAPSQAAELHFVAQKIRGLLDKGVKADQIAILFRHNRDQADLQAILTAWEIPFQTEGGDNVLKSEPIRQLLGLLGLILKLRETTQLDDLYEVMLYAWTPTDSLAVMKAARAAGERKLSIVDFISERSELGLDPEYATLQTFIQKLQDWSVLDFQEVLPLTLETIFRESGYLDWVLAHPQSISYLLELQAVFDLAKKVAAQQSGHKLQDFINSLEIMREYAIPLEAEDVQLSAEAVCLSTVHKAKGREWEYVFMVHVLDKKWGNNTKRQLLPLPDDILKYTQVSEHDPNDDERRLCYVAMTRAREQAFMTYSQRVLANGRSKDVVASMFASEIQDFSTVKFLDSDQNTFSSEEELQQALTPVSSKPITSEAKDFFTEILKDFKLSVTALNTYLRDPQEFIVNNLLRVPRAKPEYMAFGTAVHGALEKMIQHWIASQETIPLPSLLKDYEKTLRQEIINDQDLTRRIEYGREVLTTYHQHLSTQLAAGDLKPFQVEQFFGSGLSTTYLGDIALTGRIDRIDWLNQEAKEVSVVDYKTGKAKSQNFILGKVASMELSERERALPEAIRGPYKRQLLFYKLLTELDTDFKPRVTQGVFEFVEPNNRGKLVQRVFDLPDSEVEQLKELIVEVMAEMRRLEFLE